MYKEKDGCISPENDDIMGQMMLALRYGNAQKSSSDTGQHVKDTASKLVKQGKFMEGKAPYGYQLILSGEISKHGRELHKLEIIPEQAEIIKNIYMIYLLIWNKVQAKRTNRSVRHQEGAMPLSLACNNLNVCSV